MVKRNSTSASSNNCLNWWREKFASWKNIYNKYCQYTMTAIQMIKRIHISSKFEQLPRKLEDELPSRIQLTVNSSWFRAAMWAKHKQSEIQMVKRNSTSASSNNCLHWWGEKFASWNKNLVIKYCQCTMTAIQMIKRISVSSKFE